MFIDAYICRGLQVHESLEQEAPTRQNVLHWPSFPASQLRRRGWLARRAAPWADPNCLATVTPGSSVRQRQRVAPTHTCTRRHRRTMTVSQHAKARSNKACPHLVGAGGPAACPLSPTAAEALDSQGFPRLSSPANICMPSHTHTYTFRSCASAVLSE